MKVKEMSYKDAMDTLKRSADALYKAAGFNGKETSEQKAKLRGQSRVFARDYRNAESARKRETGVGQDILG